MTRIFQPWLYRCLFLLSLLISLGWGHVFPNIVLPSPSPAVAVEQPTRDNADPGLAHYNAGRFAAAIAVWESALKQTQDDQKQAVLHSNMGQAYRQIGKPDRAIQHWEAAITFYQRDRSPNHDQTMAQLLTEQAQAYSDLGQHQVAVERSQTAIQLTTQTKDLATQAAAQGAMGHAYWALGEFDMALTAHQQSLAIACTLNQPNLTARALNNLGNVFVSQAERLRYQSTAAQQEGETTEANDLNQLANRNLQVALAAFQQSATVSRRVAGTTETTALLNLNRLLQEFPQFTTIPALPELTCSQLNVAAVLNSPALRSPQAQASPSNPAAAPPNPSNRSGLVGQMRSQILTRLGTAPNSQDKAFGYINLANQLLLATARSPQIQELDTAKLWLEQALTVARSIQDSRAESFALGTLGRVYELNRQYETALDLTRKAQFLAQSVNAADSLYRWQWQSGRIFKATGQSQAAIAAYEQAIATLQTIRSDIIIASKDLQFDFRDSIEPVYRELMGLLLTADDRAATIPNPTVLTNATAPKALAAPPTRTKVAQAGSSATPSASNKLEKVLDVLELLKLAELQNFFGDDCVQVAKNNIAAEAGTTRLQAANSAIDPQAAVVYSIVLSDRSYELLRLPDGRLKKYPIQLSGDSQPTIATHAALTAQIDRLRSFLEKRSTDEYLTEAQAMYQALIRPLEADLQAANPSTLIFINDGVLRKVPMAALHDGNQFLIQKYPIATTPSLALTNRRPLDRANTQALVVGLTLEQPPFAALPNVQDEVQEVYQLLGGTKLLDQDFTLKRVQERLQGQHYSIVHMATHGKFGSDANSTFLLAYRDRITLNTLDQVLRTHQTEQPVELLTLSACQTATGDERSTLGIAGLAVRAGVKSAVATLWFINDEATVPLVEEFYTQLLKPGTTKARALQLAQVKMIDEPQYSHPAVWSSFILIGNWL